MADLNLSEECKQYQELARDFAQNEIATHAHQFDASGVFPKDIYKKAWELGLINVRMPDYLGGLGLSALDAIVIAEELAAACAGISTAILANDLAVAPLLVAGSAEQKETFLAPLMSELALASCTIAEGNSILYKEKGTAFALYGTATCINVSQAPWMMVSASPAAGTAGNTMNMIVPLPLAGLSVSPKLPALGLKCADICTVTFDAVSLSKSNLLGQTDNVQLDNREIAAFSDALVASFAVGIGRSALEHSVRYSKERHTMGKPIAMHQAVGFMLADLAKDTEASRLLSRKAAWLIDAGDTDCALSATAKAFACQGTMCGTTDAVQVYGGYGYSKEYPVEKLMRDAKSLQLFFANCTESKLYLGKQLTGTA